MVSSLLVLVLSATGSDAVAARVDANLITAGEVSSRARGAGVAPPLALDDLIGETLLAEAARREGKKVPAEVAARARAERARVAVDLLVERDVYSRVKVSDPDVLRALHAEQDKARVSMVILQTREQAQAALDRIRGGSTFQEESKGSVDDFTRARLGSLGWATTGSLGQALADGLASAPVGQLVGPLAVDGGFAVARVEERKPADDMTLATQVDEARPRVVQEARENAARRYLEDLLQRSGARVDTAFLVSTGNTLDASGKDKGRAAATAGKVKVTYAQVVEALKQAAVPPGGGAATPEMKERITRRLITRALLEKAALEAGLDAAPQATAAAWRVERGALASAEVARIRKGVPAPTDAQLEAIYKAREKDFRTPAGRPCWRIAAPTEADARALRDRVAAGEPLESVAKGPAAKVSGARVGNLGVVPEADLEKLRTSEPALAAALAAAAPGTPTAPVKTKAGWEVLSCKAPEAARQRTFAEVKPALVMQEREEAAFRAIRARVEALRKGAKVSIDEGVVAAIETAPRGHPPTGKAPPGHP